MDVTATDSDGKKIFEASRYYHTQSTNALSTETVLGPEKKLGFIRDTSIQPFAAKEETIEIPLPPDVRAALVEVNLTYQPRPGNVYPIHKVVRKVSLDQTK